MVPEAGVQAVGETPCPGGLGGGGDPALGQWVGQPTSMQELIT